MAKYPKTTGELVTVKYNGEPKRLDDAVADIGSRIASLEGYKPVVYGIRIDATESNPSAAVTYLKDAAGMTPAHMDYAAGAFDYGSWADAFFMPRPCMVKSSGEVDYYLDPGDYTKKEDGTDSDVANTAYDGNAMMEWGQNGKRVWMKTAPSADGQSADIFISDVQVDLDYHAYPFTATDGSLLEHFYTAIYNGSEVDGKLRSISGQWPVRSRNAAGEISLAEANNPDADTRIWYTEVYCDIALIQALLVLMGKSLNTQEVFGQGWTNMYDGSDAHCGMKQTGSMDQRGLFFGSNLTSSQTDGVKVFGMEHWWGNQWRRYAGHVAVQGVHKVKWTREGGGYNTTGDGYGDLGNTAFTGASGGYQNKFVFTGDGAFLPVGAGGSSSTYTCDGFWFNNAITGYAYRGGRVDYGVLCGGFCLYLSYAASYAYWAVGAALSLKNLG